MYVDIKSQMSSIMNPIRTEWSELYALNLIKIASFDFVYTLVSANIDHSTPNLGKTYDQQILNVFCYGSDWVEQLELSALELGKIPACTFVYALASTNINQSTPNLVKM